MLGPKPVSELGGGLSALLGSRPRMSADVVAVAVESQNRSLLALFRSIPGTLSPDAAQIQGGPPCTFWQTCKAPERIYVGVAPQQFALCCCPSQGAHAAAQTRGRMRGVPRIRTCRTLAEGRAWSLRTTKRAPGPHDRYHRDAAERDPCYLTMRAETHKITVCSDHYDQV